MAAHHRDIPIPPRDERANARNYHGVRVKLEASEANEPLLDVSEFGIAGESYYCRKDGLNAPYYRVLAGGFDKLLLRRGVVARLKQVNEVLRLFGVEVYVWDAFRPIACQRELWDYFMGQAKLKRPNASEEDWKRWSDDYCSDPSGYDPANPRTWPTHFTGGAVDLTLRRICNGELLYMGSVFDDAACVSHTAHFEGIPDQELSASAFDARANRRMLYWAMFGAGFSNFPNEWWHYDYGTQMWVTNRLDEAGVLRPSEAFYGPAELRDANL
jgi:D-alanyl-D-alanine dipeptidase